MDVGGWVAGWMQVAVEALPVGGTGKIVKKDLREKYAGHFVSAA